MIDTLKKEPKRIGALQADLVADISHILHAHYEEEARRDNR